MAEIDHNALLLQVMAHDLLAPLTAIKWQVEVIAREGANAPRLVEHLQTVHDSTVLGITLTKHAHVAGCILMDAYEQDRVHVSLTDIVRAAAVDLTYQYERHGLTLAVEIDSDAAEYDIDTSLLKLLVWSIAKYFLSSAPAHAQIEFRGIMAPNEKGDRVFVLICTAANIPEAEQSVVPFTATEATGAYDQAFVFAKLIHKTAALIGASVTASARGNQLVIETSFDTLR